MTCCPGDLLLVHFSSELYRDYLCCICLVVAVDRHVPGSCNKAAHCLAALGVGCSEGDNHWTSEVPGSVLVNVVDDLSTMQ